MIEQTVSIERMEDAIDIFGSFDENIRLIEQELGVRVVGRDGQVKISGEEAEFLFGCGCEKSAELILNDCGAKLVMITLGSEGCFIKNRAAQCRVPAARVKAADTTGAGDIFGGSAAYCLLSSGKAPEDLNEEELNAMGRFACAAAGLSVQRPGGISSVPGKEEILALLAAGD